MLVLFARRSLSRERKRSWHRRRQCLSVCQSVSLTGGCTVEKQLIGSGCRLGWWVGSVKRWVY